MTSPSRTSSPRSAIVRPIRPPTVDTTLTCDRARTVPLYVSEAEIGPRVATAVVIVDTAGVGDTLGVGLGTSGAGVVQLLNTTISSTPAVIGHRMKGEPADAVTMAPRHS